VEGLSLLRSRSFPGTGKGLFALLPVTCGFSRRKGKVWGKQSRDGEMVKAKGHRLKRKLNKLVRQANR